ncbi:biotin transporter BioY [Neobacillus sp. PS3-40]|uniref:biotin transporter BioY n=1 Tax=Neobacillus sp. PS3-40 TaxID=3070679 RepID=UPI0027E20DE0|nr:biotin transporter BioY [Neobacillus sp. PS3-40]WML44868.1 biotin transporter BioY [Neobacillus sp. PS3-40]
MKLRTTEITLAAMFVALMTVGANITSIAPFLVIGGVPITLQTFFAILAGVVLGSRLGAISMTVYALVGLVGVPVFAKFGAGLGTIISPTFGFIISFIFTAFATGYIIEKMKKTVGVFIFAALIGLVINYVMGTNLMYVAYKFWSSAPEGFTYKMAWLWMVVPLPKDIFLAILAGIVGHRLERTVLSRSQFRKLRKAS